MNLLWVKQGFVGEKNVLKDRSYLEDNPPGQVKKLLKDTDQLRQAS